ncbi:hypothetical protein DSO57_1023576 [Entomophthora muscae]|uniref:Uncharacterized protein n=1 Tax=Entomophthora muscae TaxID=34485 RepID=A0ACC2T2X2_9FUNG|nr:hypothetical protein DSO57_1023576 [Entomophthora muscae]
MNLAFPCTFHNSCLHLCHGNQPIRNSPFSSSPFTHCYRKYPHFLHLPYHPMGFAAVAYPFNALGRFQLASSFEQTISSFQFSSQPRKRYQPTSLPE